ncbi:MAG: phosphohistidine phosphatase SixA [Thermoproteus sp. AZ2]|uniref:Phosphohistidine phosphatase SixA n=1 Tax=Thermoproteus sp. AZ2 TaxID=1609232 RepID=A0ACC6V2T3_9CREN
MLYLASHGKAYTELEDPDRRLTDEGIRETRRVALRLREAGVVVDEVIYGNSLRARQTAEIFAEYLSPKIMREADGLGPNDAPSIWAAMLRGTSKPTMVVGHAPFLARLATILVVGRPDPPIVSLKCSSVLKLEKDQGGWRIAWLLTPRLL